MLGKGIECETRLEALGHYFIPTLDPFPRRSGRRPSSPSQVPDTALPLPWFKVQQLFNERPPVGASHTAEDRQACRAAPEEPTVREGRRAFNNDSHNHSNTAVVNRTRGTRVCLRGMTRQT